MATIQNKSTVQNTQDFITIQDLFYLCLNKWHWFAISLALCLGVATFYLLRTPSVYVRAKATRKMFFFTGAVGIMLPPGFVIIRVL